MALFEFILYNINMIISNKHYRIIYVALLVIFSMTTFVNIAKAGTITDSFSGLFNFVNKNIVGQVKKDFCKNYILAVSSGEWKEGEFRTSLGRRVCTSYSVSTDVVGKIVPASIQALNGNSSIVEIFNTASINNPKPDVYVPNVIAKNSVLDTNQIVNLTNVARKDTDINLIYLKENKTLNNIAMIRVKDMFDKQYFEHNSPSGDNASKEATKNGYSYITIGENIALGNFDGNQGLITSWMNSPGHRANILNKNYTEIGVYAMPGLYKGQKVWIAAQIFGKPGDDCKEPNQNTKDKIAKYKVSADNILNDINKIDSELRTINTSDAQTYNSKVAERNTLVGLYNNLAAEIKILVAEFNKETAIYNACIKII